MIVEKKTYSADSWDWQNIEQILVQPGTESFVVLQFLLLTINKFILGCLQTRYNENEGQTIAENVNEFLDHHLGRSFQRVQRKRGFRLRWINNSQVFLL